MDIKIKVEYRNDKMKDARIASGLSQSQLAKESGINVRVIQNYEQGIRDINGAKIITILKICNALGCSLKDILTDEETLAELERYEHKAALREEMHLSDR